MLSRKSPIRQAADAAAQLVKRLKHTVCPLALAQSILFALKKNQKRKFIHF
jgi:hypothetical protein